MNKGLLRILNLLLQTGAERDRQFRDEARKRAREGLRVVGVAMILIPLMMAAAVEFIALNLPFPAASIWLMKMIVVAGAVTLASGRLPRLRNHPRIFGWLLAVIVANCLIWSSLLRAAAEPMFLAYVNAQVAVLLLISLISIPFRPVHVLALGAAIELCYLVSSQLALRWELVPSSNILELNLIFLTMLVGLSTAVSVNVYRQFRETYLAHAEQIETMKEVRDAQCRMMLSDSAASMGRLAAALSHELNNPLGILKSNLDTMRSFLWEKKDLSPKQRETLSRLGAELCHDSMESVERLQSMIARMQRFTNLDRAETLPVDLNAMLRDVAEIVSDSSDRTVEFEFGLQPLPNVSLRPQLMSAVFSALMQNAADATPPGLPVRVASGLEGTTVAVRIEGQGPGIPADQQEFTFDPAFQVKGNRVAACNWSMFSARQAVRQHGGEIRLESGNGTGARVVVTLPAQLMNG